MPLHGTSDARPGQRTLRLQASSRDRRLEVCRTAGPSVPATDLMKGYPPEIKLWWDGFGASSWGSRSEDSPALAVAYEMQFMAGPNRKDDRQTWPGGIGALSKRLVEILQPKQTTVQPPNVLATERTRASPLAALPRATRCLAYGRFPRLCHRYSLDRRRPALRFRRSHPGRLQRGGRLPRDLRRRRR